MYCAFSMSVQALLSDQALLVLNSIFQHLILVYARSELYQPDACCLHFDSNLLTS